MSRCCSPRKAVWTRSAMALFIMFMMMSLTSMPSSTLALAVDDLPLLVHDVVVLQHGLTGLEVPGLPRWSGRSHGAGEHLVLDGGVLVEVHTLHHVLVIRSPPNRRMRSSSRGDVEPGLAGVALTAGTAAELVVDAAGFVALGADDEQAAGLADLLRPRGDLPPCAGPASRQTASGRPGSPRCRSRHSRWPRR